MLKINSTDKIERLIGYLKPEISKRKLNPTIAKIFLYGMWNSRNPNEVISRPKWTFAIQDFDKYLNFYKRYNLLHWNGSSTKFIPDQDLRHPKEVTVDVLDKKTIDYILEIGNRIPEFQKYYSKA